MSEIVNIHRWDAVEIGVEISGLPEGMGLEFIREVLPEYTYETDPLFLAWKRRDPKITPQDVLDTSTIQVGGSIPYWRDRLEKLGYNVQVSEST
jgi:hypothetical protein